MQVIFNGYEEWQEAYNTRVLATKKIPTGISYIDDITMGGVCRNDFVLISADSGVGKTDIACMIAEQMALNGVKVLYHGLELEKGEGLNRIAFRILSELVSKYENKSYFTYGMFKQMKMEEYLEKYKEEFDDKFKMVIDNISWRRKTPDGVDLLTLKKELIENRDNADIFIIDHLSMIDTGTENELKETEKVIKAIDYFCESNSKPVILVVHIRKEQAVAKKYLPNAHDILGTKHIVNIPKLVIMLGRDYNTKIIDNRFPTLIRMLKNRDNGDTGYVGRIYYNKNKSMYDKDYEVAYDKGNGKELIEIEENSQYPRWAKKMFMI
jgi:replicative DNA helicase